MLVPLIPVAPGLSRVPATVIVGGGILGLSTAYFLALSISERRRRAGRPMGSAQIFVVEQASAICAAASGQCEGALGDFGFDSETQPLASLSFKLFAQLAQEMKDAGGSPGYSQMKVHAVFSGRYDPSHPRLPFPVEREEDLAELPSWLRVQQSWKAGLIDDGARAARLDPPKFSSFIRQKCEQLGVQFFLNSTVVQVHSRPGAHTALYAVDLLTRSSADEDRTLRIPCHALVIAAGSWSTGVLSSLFPDSNANIPMAEQQPVQTWLRLCIPTSESQNDCNQVWLSPLDGNIDIHASTSIDGQMFAAGKIDTAAFPPPLPQFVHPTSEEVSKLTKQTLDHVYTSEPLKVVQSGRAYMPRTAHKKPVMARVPWQLLLPSVVREKAAQSDDGLGGVFLNFGHDLDGFTLGLGSGQVMAQLILDQETSVDISPFGLPETD